MRSSLWVTLAVVLAAARPAAAQCTFHTDYYAPKSPGVCTAETVVPAGCPIHVIAPPGSRPERYQPTVNLEPATVRVATLGVLALPSSEVDVTSCDCATRSFVASYDQLELTIAGLQAGDRVSFHDQEAADDSNVQITAAGPCPPPAWPTSVHVAARCDLCPAPGPAPVDPPRDDAAAGGCSSSRSGTWLVGLVVLGLIARRTRRR